MVPSLLPPPKSAYLYSRENYNKEKQVRGFQNWRFVLFFLFVMYFYICCSSPFQVLWKGCHFLCSNPCFLVLAWYHLYALGSSFYLLSADQFIANHGKESSVSSKILIGSGVEGKGEETEVYTARKMNQERVSEGGCWWGWGGKDGNVGLVTPCRHTLRGS